ncbi:SDR family NAD(P)-dependent oxidoreductase [Burkholderia cepacia]|uniref:SDR family NAD(P)-dependent oxidoreductase n=1 Tax=Burkholderia cepacia TaxID=292 RepID=UPI002AB7D8CC|nr:SDR family NAD(P)-dependent oxidoreductase [Burkholderia cepacia]
MHPLIIGSTGVLGREITHQLKVRGYSTIETNRKDCSSENYLDVSNPSSALESVKGILDRAPQIDALIYIPAISINRITHRISIDEWANVFNTNFFSLTSILNAFLPHLIKKKGGKIQIISSNAGVTGQAGAAPYAASKAAINNLVKSVSLEYSRYGISIHSICPGYFQGGMLSELSPERLQKIEQSIPAGYIATAGEIAQFCINCLENGKYLTSANLPITGGI